MIKALGYATNHSFSRLKPLAFERQEAGSDEVDASIRRPTALEADRNARCFDLMTQRS